MNLVQLLTELRLYGEPGGVADRAEAMRLHKQIDIRCTSPSGFVTSGVFSR